MKKFLIAFIGLFLSFNLMGQTREAQFQTAVIQTSAQCGDCKQRIEDGLNYFKGVRFAELDNDTKKVTVKYAPSKVSLGEIKQKIADIGYDADEVKAPEEAVKKLPACCQPGGMEKH